MFRLARKDLPSYLGWLAKRHELFVPTEKLNGGSSFEPFTGQEPGLDSLTSYPIKKFFLPPREQLLQFRRQRKNFSSKSLSEAKSTVLFGVKSCDLRDMLKLDNVFLEQKPVDPYYGEKREKTFLIGLDCLEADEHCFCTSVGAHIPTGFDLMFWRKGKDFFIELGSEKGKRLISPHMKKTAYTKFHPKQECKVKLKLADLTNNLRSSFDHPYWKELEEKCLGCGTCTQVCGCCYCFFMEEHSLPNSKTSVRRREWDSCMLAQFSEVAGNHVFRESRASRLRQRIFHKFVWFESTYGEIGCTGCGRCSRECTARIFIEDILKKLGEKGGKK